MRFFNAVSDSTALDFSLNGTVDAASIAYGASNPNFVSASSNTYDIDLTEHGQSADLWAVTATLNANSSYAVVALGEENYGTETRKRAQLAVVNVDRSAPNGSKARLYVVNAFEESPGLPTPSIDFTNPGDNPTFSANGVAPASAASLLVDSGTQDFLVRQTGSQGNYVEKTLTLSAGSVYLILVSGVNGATGAAAPAIQQIQLQTG